LFRHLLVPLDLSMKNQRALDAALRLAKSEDAKVTLLHVVQTLAQLPAKELRAFYDKLGAESAKKLARSAERFRKAGLAVRAEVLFADSVLEETVGFVRAKSVDLIVLTSHRVGAERSLRDWGTLSYKLAIVAPCPVLLVK
jgi:universal stress protein A